MICKYCGRQIANDAEYCTYCGRKVLRVPPVFTMSAIGTGIATEAIRSYSEWGFYHNPDAELDPETGQKRETEFDNGSGVCFGAGITLPEAFSPPPMPL